MNFEDRAPRSILLNCGLLDMRETTEQVVSRIRHVNTGCVLVSSETRAYLSMFSINLGIPIEVPDDVEPKIVWTPEIMGNDAFTGEGKSKFIINMSNIVLEPDVTADGLERSWEEVVNLGTILFPKHVVGQVTDKVTTNMGTLTSYRPSAQLIVGDALVDEVFLVSLADGVDLVVTGDLKILEVVPNDLLDQKISTVHVRGEVVCCAENERMLRSKFDPYVKAPNTTVIPEDHELVQRDLMLKAVVIRSWNGRKIYCTGNVILHEDIDEETLGTALGSLVCTGKVLCPERLGDVLSSVCDNLNSDVAFYSGALWVVDTDFTLRKSRLDFVDGTVTLYNSGDVVIEGDVEPKSLYDLLAAVYNWGSITCNPDQMSAIQARMVVNEGTLNDATECEESDEEQVEERDDGTLVINAGYHKLGSG